MTVADTPAFEAPVTVADGVTTYTYNFDAYDPSHVQVQHTEADGTINFLTYDTDYSVVPVDAPGIGGTVTITLGLTAGDEVVLFRDTSLAQSTSLPNQGPFFAETVEREFDRVAMLAQESARDVALAVRFPIGATANAQFPVPVEGKSIVGRMVNGELVYKADGLSDADLTTAMDAAVVDATAAASGFADAAEADAAQTALDRIATAADVVQTNADVAQTTIDKAATAADVVQTNADVVQTAADVLATVNAAADVALAAVPVGQVTIQNGAVDAGYLRFGEGGSFDRTVYPELATWWDANGDKWGMSAPEIAAGDLPDFQGRVLRTIGGLGPAVGAEQEDAFQGHWHFRKNHSIRNIDSPVAGAGSILKDQGDGVHTNGTDSGVLDASEDTTNGTPRTATETRVKSIGVRYQIKAYGALVNSGTADLVAIETAQAQAVRKDAQTLSGAEKLQILDNLGTLLNRSYTENGSAASSTNNVNVDTSIPQITEGAQAISTSYTPKKIGSTICVKAVVYASCNNNRDVTGSLFIDGGADAVAVVSKTASTNEGEQMNIEYSFTPTDLSAIAIEARVGSHTDTCWVNRRSSSDYFGGLMKSTMTIEEYS